MVRGDGTLGRKVRNYEFVQDLHFFKKIIPIHFVRIGCNLQQRKFINRSPKAP